MNPQAIKSNSKFGSGCLILFALPFASVGVFMTVMIVWTLYDWRRMGGWEETPATIVSVELERGDDTERVVAEYRYTFDKQEFTGDRVGIHSASDNLGDFHQRAYKTLKASIRQKKTVPCYVNPHAPSEAILYRQLRWELLGIFLLFALVFGGVGFGLILATFVSRAEGSDIDTRAAQFPEEPWKWKQEWAEGVLQNDSRTLLIATGLAAVFWNLISWPVVSVVVPQELAEGERWVLLLLLFPAVGLLLLAFAVRALLLWNKFGATTFEMASTPGVIGGTLAGVVHIRNIDAEGGYHQRLTCVESRSSDDNSHEEVLWEATRIVDKEISTGEVGVAAVPVLFHIPYDCLPTTPPDQPERIAWKLNIKAKSRGLDFNTTFEPPVFETADSSPDYEPDEDLISAYAREEKPEALYRRNGIGRSVDFDAIRIRFGLFRHISVSMGVTFFLAIWMGAVVGMWMMEAPIWFACIFLVVGLLVACWMLDLWLWRADFEVSKRGLAGRFGWLGFHREWSADEIGGITVQRGMQSGSTVYYDIRLHPHHRKPFVIGKRVVGKTDAEELARDLRHQLGLAEE